MAKAKTPKKRDDKDLPISNIAKPIVNSLIGVHGLRRAYDIAQRIAEMATAEVQSQMRRHPDEWTAKFKRQVLGAGAVQDVPTPPDIPAPPIV